MNWADYAIIVILALSVLMGLWRGLISEVFALGVWVAAVWVAWVFGGDVSALFADSVSLPSARMVLGYGACFFAVLILGAILNFILHKLVEGTGLSGSDRLLGMVFGLVRGVLLIVVGVMLLGFTPFPRDPWWQQSQLLPSFRSAAEWLGQRLPENVERYIDFNPAAVTKAMADGLAPPASRSTQTPAAASSVAPASTNNQD